MFKPDDALPIRFQARMFAWGDLPLRLLAAAIDTDPAYLAVVRRTAAIKVIDRVIESDLMMKQASGRGAPTMRQRGLKAGSWRVIGQPIGLETALLPIMEAMGGRTDAPKWAPFFMATTGVDVPLPGLRLARAVLASPDTDLERLGAATQLDTLAHVMRWASEPTILGQVIDHLARQHEDALERRLAAQDAQGTTHAADGVRLDAHEAAVLAAWPDGARVVRLLRPQELDAEGLRMAHCLRSTLHYAQEAWLGAIGLYSYRDARGRPQATWEVVGPNYMDPVRGRPSQGTVLQLQGPRNGPINDALARVRIAQVLERSNAANPNYAHRLTASLDHDDWNSLARFATQALRDLDHDVAMTSEDLQHRALNRQHTTQRLFQTLQQRLPWVRVHGLAQAMGLHGEPLVGLSISTHSQDPRLRGRGLMLTVNEHGQAMVARRSDPFSSHPTPRAQDHLAPPAPPPIGGGNDMDVIIEEHPLLLDASSTTESDEPCVWNGDLASESDSAWWRWIASRG